MAISEVTPGEWVFYAAFIGLISWGIVGTIRSRSATSSASQEEREEREAERQRQAENQREARRQAEKTREDERQRQAERQRKATRDADMAEAERQRDAEQRRRAEQQRKEETARQQERQRQQRATQREWWDVLGVSAHAPPAEVRRAYAEKIKQYHPDRVNGMAPELVQLSELRTKELNAAFTQWKRGR